MEQPQPPQPPPLPKQTEILHRHEPRKRNSSKVNLAISFVFHTVIIVGAVYFAARSGALGHKMKTIVATLEQKQKKPEPEKEKQKENKPEPPKVQEAKATTAPPRIAVAAVAPPPDTAAATVAPAATVIGDVDFSGGANVQAGDPNEVYKGLVQTALRSKWRRPEDTADDSYSAEVELNVDRNGKLGDYQWVRGSGDKHWDDSVKAALSQTKSVGAPPPKGFPSTFTVKFDVDTVPVDSNPLEVSSR